MTLAQRVVGHPKAARGEEVVAVAIVFQRPRLANQPVDHVPVVDVVFLRPAESREHIYPTLDVILLVFSDFRYDARWRMGLH